MASSARGQKTSATAVLSEAERLLSGGVGERFTDFRERDWSTAATLGSRADRRICADDYAVDQCDRSSLAWRESDSLRPIHSPSPSLGEGDRRGGLPLRHQEGTEAGLADLRQGEQATAPRPSAHSTSPYTAWGATAPDSGFPSGSVPLPSLPFDHDSSTASSAVVIAAALKHENELLRSQLADLIKREGKQRAELQQLKSEREWEANVAAQDACAEQSAEVARLSSLLQSSQEELSHASSERDRLASVLGKLASQTEEDSASAGACVAALQASTLAATVTAARFADGVEHFQRQVLPTFQAPPGFQPADPAQYAAMEPALGKQLQRLERGLSLLRMIVEAKSDTLVMIRGKLKAENEGLKEELGSLRGEKSLGERTLKGQDDQFRREKGFLRQELHSLQQLYEKEVRQLQGRLGQYEAGESQGSTRIKQLEAQVGELAGRIKEAEGEKERLEESVREESSVRAQLAAQLAAQKRDHDALRAELDTLKLSQKFLVRQPKSSSRIPAERMDLMNMINQLLQEVNKLKAEKIALKEELKAQRRLQMLERVQHTLTARDVALAATDKVRDSEVAAKLVWQRLGQLSNAGGPERGPVVQASEGLLIKASEGEARESTSLTAGEGDGNAQGDSLCKSDSPLHRLETMRGGHGGARSLAGETIGSKYVHSQMPKAKNGRPHEAFGSEVVVGS